MKPSVPYSSATAKLKTACGNLYLTTVIDDNKSIVSVLLQLGKAGGCAKAHLSVLSEYINLAIPKGKAEVIAALSAITGVTCSEGNSCVETAVQYMLKFILKYE